MWKCFQVVGNKFSKRFFHISTYFMSGQKLRYLGNISPRGSVLIAKLGILGASWIIIALDFSPSVLVRQFSHFNSMYVILRATAYIAMEFLPLCFMPFCCVFPLKWWFSSLYPDFVHKREPLFWLLEFLLKFSEFLNRCSVVYLLFRLYFSEVPNF